MRFGELPDFVSETTAEPIVLTVRGTDYSFPGSLDELPMAVGLQLIAWQQKVQAAQKAAQDGEEPDMSFLDEGTQQRLTQIMFGPRHQELQEALTPPEYERVASTLMLYYLYGSEIAAEAWKGTLDKAAESLGETSGRTGRSSTRTAPTGSTPTSTSMHSARRAARLRGAQSSKRGTSSSPTSTASTAPTSPK